ncbi:MAG TPA: lasso RiPP family leader peptide-containing protein [Thermoanaerobaculia bacterium]|nr:lasso RiPP family leader peptide-containing protein [Thermoanaerobaculia bacterium]
MNAHAAPKRPYHPPRLTVYGNIRDLTREGGRNNDKDGGNNARNNRT